MSYATFCKLRPYWIVSPDCNNRNTCLCKLHSNFGLLLKKLNALKIISETTTTEILQNITCDGKQEERCLECTCPECISCNVNMNQFDENEITVFSQWASKKVEILVKNNIKLVQKTVKEEKNAAVGEIVSKFKSLLPLFMQHECNIKHQYDIVRKIKNSLSEHEILLHCDFSENYNCKYSDEIQSVHFGGSRNQVTLHTCVLYYYSVTENLTKCQSICTLSSNLRHDPLAICAHLKPLILKIQQLVPTIKNVHFLSDGAGTQYRNKNMFYLMATHLAKEFNAENFYWHYYEKGHGKGAPDGVGGCLKRTADNLVACGTDIPNVDILFQELEKSCPGIILYKIEDDNITQLENMLPTKLPMFKGTLSIHQITWSSKNKSTIQARRLSCVECAAEIRCPHFTIGQISVKTTENPQIRKKLCYSDVYSDTDTDTPQDELIEVEADACFQQSQFKINDFVIVRLAGKKKIKDYAAMIDLKLSDSEYSVKYLRRLKNNYFVPESDRSYTVDTTDIITKLELPVMNNKQQYLLVDIDKYNLE